MEIIVLLWSFCRNVFCTFYISFSVHRIVHCYLLRYASCFVIDIIQSLRLDNVTEVEILPIKTSASVSIKVADKTFYFSHCRFGLLFWSPKWPMNDLVLSKEILELNLLLISTLCWISVVDWKGTDDINWM